MNTIHHKFDKTWTAVAVCRPYRYVAYVSHVSHVNPRLIWGHENRTPSSTCTITRDFIFRVNTYRSIDLNTRPFLHPHAPPPCEG